MSKLKPAVSGPPKLVDAPVFDWLLAETQCKAHALVHWTNCWPQDVLCLHYQTFGLHSNCHSIFNTAQSLGVLFELQEHLQERFLGTGDLAAKGLLSLPPQVYR